MSVEDNVAVILCWTWGILTNVPIEEVADFEQSFVELLRARHRADVLDVIKGGQLTDDVAEKLTAAAKEVSAKYVQQ